MTENLSQADINQSNLSPTIPMLTNQEMKGSSIMDPNVTNDMVESENPILEQKIEGNA